MTKSITLVPTICGGGWGEIDYVLGDLGSRRVVLIPGSRWVLVRRVRVGGSIGTGTLKCLECAEMRWRRSAIAGRSHRSNCEVVRFGLLTRDGTS